MKIVVMGTGGTGGYYGALLAGRANDVTFVARGEHLAAIRRAGLQVKSVLGDFTLSPANATDDPSGLSEPDLILFCTKTYDTDQAARQIEPIVGKSTSVLSLQNGIDAAERIGRVVGMEHIIGGATWISSAVEAPGVIHHVSGFRRVVMGELDGRRTPRLQAIQDAFQDAGVEAEASDDILKVLWTKFLFISPTSSFGSLTRLPAAAYRAVPETRRQIVRLMREIEAVARSQGAALDADVVEQTLAFMDGAASNIRTSMQLDVESGHASEIESMLGVIGRKGRAAGVDTPLADALYALLLPVELHARGE